MRAAGAVALALTSMTALSGGQAAPARVLARPSAPALAQAARPAAPPAARPSLVPSLGAVSFPNSGSANAQSAFLRGVAWLHSFGYEDAIDAFREAQLIDSGFAMAYWGEALAFSQPLWFHEEPEPARAALRKLGATPVERRAKAKTPREQAFLGAVEELWGSGDTRTRALNYSAAMAKMAADHPADDEAQVFYALSLLAVLPRGDASLPLREKAGAIAEAVFARNPKHPGAAHYVIHAYDHGALASRALTAARAYARIAPAASHALHMPAHTFVQLGFWEEAAATDRASWDASVQWAAARKLPHTMRDFHSLSWLHYQWTQLGRFKEAAGAMVLIDEALRVARPTDETGGHRYTDSTIGRGIGPEALRNDRGSMRARYVIESERWTEMKGQGNFEGIDDLFALGMAAVKLGDRPRVEAAIEEFRRASAPSQPAELREQAQIMLHELQALHLMAQARQPEAFAEMDRATLLQARMPKPIGRPFPVKGADELYGELLLEAGRAQAAIEWFDKALRRTPNRSRALLGLARAKAKTGDAAGSRKAYEQLLLNWRNADANLPELKEARAVVGR